MMFEVEDLSHASPATVSRCGMVLLEPRQLGFEPLIQSYIQMIGTYLEEKVVTKINKILMYLCTLTMEFVRTTCVQAVPTGSNFLVHNILQIFDLFVMDYKKRDGHETLDIPGNIEDICMNAIIFAAIWGVGGQLNEHTRPIFDVYLKKLIAGENVQEEYKIDVED
jgi:dynein heavy chain